MLRRLRLIMKRLQTTTIAPNIKALYTYEAILSIIWINIPPLLVGAIKLNSQQVLFSNTTTQNARTKRGLPIAERWTASSFDPNLSTALHSPKAGIGGSLKYRKLYIKRLHTITATKGLT